MTPKIETVHKMEKWNFGGDVVSTAVARVFASKDPTNRERVHMYDLPTTRPSDLASRALIESSTWIREYSLQSIAPT
jgi:hypothetical protein